MLKKDNVVIKKKIISLKITPIKIYLGSFLIIERYILLSFKLFRKLFDPFESLELFDSLATLGLLELLDRKLVGKPLRFNIIPAFSILLLPPSHVVVLREETSKKS